MDGSDEGGIRLRRVGIGWRHRREGVWGMVEGLEFEVGIGGQKHGSRTKNVDEVARLGYKNKMKDIELVQK